MWLIVKFISSHNQHLSVFQCYLFWLLHNKFLWCYFGMLLIVFRSLSLLLLLLAVVVVIVVLLLLLLVSVSWWYFTGVWVTASLLRSPGLFSVFWPNAAVWIFLIRPPTLPVPFLALGDRSNRANYYWYYSYSLVRQVFLILWQGQSFFSLFSFSLSLFNFQLYFRFLTILHQVFIQDLAWGKVMIICISVFLLPLLGGSFQ